MEAPTQGSRAESGKGGPSRPSNRPSMSDTQAVTVPRLTQL